MPVTDGVRVILVNPEIPPNTGNIARLCGATGTPLHLVHPLGFSCDDKALRRAGLDYWKEVDVFHHQSFEEALAAGGKETPILFSARAERSYLEAPYAPGARLVFGSETRGLPASILECYPTSLYRIPIWGKVRSLNLSTAVGIVVYEALRQLGALKRFSTEAFRPAGLLPGKVYVPRKGGAQKNPCSDCFACQGCSAERCDRCLGKD